MPDKVTNEEAMEAVTALREQIDGKQIVSVEQAEQINTLLDRYDEEKAERTEAQDQAKKDGDRILNLEEQLIADGAEHKEVAEKVDILTAELARAQGTIAAGDDPKAAHRETPESKAINDWCKSGDNLSPEVKALLRTDIAADGGVLVTTEMETFLTRTIEEVDQMRGLARVRPISGKSIELPIRNAIPVATYEGEEESGGESISAYTSETITPYRQTVTIPATMDQLMDSAFDMESEISTDAGEAFAVGEGNGFILGDGHKQPQGIANHAILTGAGNFRQGVGTTGEIFANDVILLQGDLKAGYNPSYILNRTTLAYLRAMRSDILAAGDGFGPWLWQPAIDGSATPTLAGAPYSIQPSMPDMATTSFSIGFGDWNRGYLIVDRTGVSVIRDNVTQKAKAIVEFTFNRWNTGRVVITEAIKLLKTK